MYALVWALVWLSFVYMHDVVSVIVCVDAGVVGGSVVCVVGDARVVVGVGNVVVFGVDEVKVTVDGDDDDVVVAVVVGSYVVVIVVYGDAADVGGSGGGCVVTGGGYGQCWWCRVRCCRWVW